MGSRCTSIIAVLLSTLILSAACVLFIFGFTDFEPESVKDVIKIKDAKANTSKLPIIDVEEFLEKNGKHSASLRFINDTTISSGILFTYPKCFYIPKSFNALRESSDLSTFKPDLKIGQAVKFHILPSPNAAKTIDFCGDHEKLMRFQIIVSVSGSIAIFLQVMAAVLTIVVICGCCKNSNLPFVVAVIGLIGFCCSLCCLVLFIYFTVNYYTLRGLDSKQVALDYGFPDQGNNTFYLFGCICVLVSNFVFVLFMFKACGQRKKEIVVNNLTALQEGKTIM